MITKEYIILSIRVNNYETELLNKYKDALTLQYQENEKDLNHIWAEISTLDYTSKSNETSIKPPINVKLKILGASEEINSSDLSINIETREFIIKYKNQAANHLPYARNQAERWKTVLQVFVERLKFIQSRLDYLKKLNNQLKRALLDIDDGKPIEEVERWLLESENNANNKNDKKSEYESKLKELGYENLEQLCDAIAKKHGFVKHERISEDDIKKVYDEIIKLKIETTIKSVTTTLRKKCEYSKTRKKENTEAS